MKIWNKVLALVLVVAMFVGLIPTTTFMSEASNAEVATYTAASYETSGVASDLKQDGLVWLDASDTTNPLELHGITPQAGAPYARMDLATAESIAGSTVFSKTSVYSHARESAGGRIRFTTTSPYIAIKAEFPMYVADYATGMKAGKYGFDVYVENTETGSYEYHGTLEPSTAPASDEAWGYEDILKFDDETAKNVMIYFPITNEVSEVYVGLKDSSYIVDSVAQYEEAAPIVYYGSSITQGGMSTKPGNTYVNTIGRMLNYDYIDLGVWGSCKGETAFANYIAGLNMSAFVFDYDHNESDATVLDSKHHAFYQIVRAAHPNIPILFVTRPDSDASGLYTATKEVIKASYDQAVAAGDPNVYYIDGESFFGYDASYLYDGVHPTDAGQAKMAEVIGTQLTAVLPISEDTMNETVELQDTFDKGTAWKTDEHNWRIDTAELAGERTGVAELGYNNIQSRNLYDYSQTSDVHLEATVHVEQAICQNSKTQYHMLIARGAADGSGSIGFGFKTAVGAEKMSLIVCEHQRLKNPQETVYYETDAIYSFNKDYRLDLFVVGNMIIAKCDGEVIYAAEVDGIAAKGYCGMVDMRASSTGESGATKAGYFDNISISSITFDSSKVDGAIVCNPNGDGVADVIQCSGDIEIASMEDRAVTISGYSNKTLGKYVGPVEVSCDGKTWTTALDQVVYVVDDVKESVTNMRDSRWNQLTSSGCSTGATWTKSSSSNVIDGNGRVVLSQAVSDYLTINPVSNQKSEPYNNFYAEYTLTIDRVAGGADEQALFDTRYFTEEHSNTVDGAIARITYANGGLSASMVRASGSYPYTNTDLADGLSVGKAMKIGLLVCDGVVSYFVNDTLVGTMTMGETKGWFILKNNKPALITATIGDFLYVPLPEKQVVDVKVGCASKVQKGQTLSTTVIPIYNWPRGEGSVVTEGVSVEGFDNTILGQQKAIVSYGGISKEVEVEVVDYEIKHAEDFLDFSLDEWSDASTDLTTKDGKLIMQASTGEVVLYGHEQQNGYAEATFAVTDSELLENGTKSTVYPLTLLYRHKGASSKTTIETRLKCLKDSSGNIVGSLECLVRTNDSAGAVSATKINGFEFGKQYTLRLTCVGNYFEVMMDNHVYYQKTLAKDHALATNSDMRFYLSNAADSGTVEVDDFVIAEYDAYTITDTTNLTLPTYEAADITDKNHERTSYLANETVAVTVNPSEGQQLKVGGLYYTEAGSETKYSVTKRAAEPGENQEICNTFLLNMPAKDIVLTDEYYTIGSQEANIGINGVSIREASADAKAAIRYTSRVYKAYNDGTKDYTLKEVGTLLFKQFGDETSIAEDILNQCYNSESGMYVLNENVYGKKVKATRVQDICDEFVDYGLYLTYASGTSLGDQNYITYTYAVYVDAEGQTVVRFSSTPVTYSYNSVAAQLGYDGL